MESTKQVDLTTTTDHFAEAERFAERADSWADFEQWTMSPEERIARQSADAQLAMAHAMIADVLADRAVAEGGSRLAAAVGDGDRLRVAAVQA